MTIKSMSLSARSEADWIDKGKILDGFVAAMCIFLEYKWQVRS